VPLAVAAIVVAFDSAAELPATLAALAAQLGPEDELIVVDNASRDGSAATVRDAAPEAVLIELEHNVGFAGGCVAGVAASRAPLLFFCNPDATIHAGCVDALRAAADEQPSWGAWQALVLLSGGEHVNTAGNITHWLGFGWAGSIEAPASSIPPEPREVSFASGAALVVRRQAWDAVGGFDPDYFMYGEDLDLGLRLWLAGWRVGIVPEARVEHDYAFTKGDYKWFYLERNRLWTVLAAYPAPLLAFAALPLLAFELALLAVAAREGWLKAKLRAQLAVLRSLPRIAARRRRVQAARRVSAGALAAQLTASLDSPYLGAAQHVPVLPRAQAAYWALVRRVLR